MKREEEGPYVISVLAFRFMECPATLAHVEDDFHAVQDRFEALAAWVSGQWIRLAGNDKARNSLELCMFQLHNARNLAVQAMVREVGR